MSGYESDTCGRRYFCIRIKKFADTKISGYVWTGPHVCTMSCQEGVDVPSLRIPHTNQASLTNLWTWGSYLLETYWHGQLFCRTFHVFCKIYADLSITLFTTRKTLQSSRKDFSCQIRPTFCCRAAAVLYLNSIAHIWYFLAEYHKTVVEKRMDHLPSRPICKRYVTYFLTRYRVFSLAWPASMQIYWNKRKHLHEKRVQLPQDFLGTPTWPPFHCFGTPKWPPVTSCENALYWFCLYPGCQRLF